MPSTRGFPDPGIEPTSLLSAASAGRFFTTDASLKREKAGALLSIKKKKKKRNEIVSVRRSE